MRPLCSLMSGMEPGSACVAGVLTAGSVARISGGSLSSSSRGSLQVFLEGWQLGFQGTREKLEAFLGPGFRSYEVSLLPPSTGRA